MRLVALWRGRLVRGGISYARIEKCRGICKRFGELSTRAARKSGVSPWRARRRKYFQKKLLLAELRAATVGHADGPRRLLAGECRHHRHALRRMPVNRVFRLR